MNRRSCTLAALDSDREQIEASFGERLTWDVKEGRKRCSIVMALEGGHADPEDAWPAVHERMAVAMARLESALTPFLVDAVRG